MAPGLAVLTPGKLTEIEVLYMIAIGCDHGGFALKQEVMRHLDELGLAYKDFGTYSEESCDYPIYGEAVARAVAAPASASPSPRTRSRASAPPCAATATPPR